jgi:hypothetical protein
MFRGTAKTVPSVGEVVGKIICGLLTKAKYVI